MADKNVINAFMWSRRIPLESQPPSREVWSQVWPDIEVLWMIPASFTAKLFGAG